MWYWFELVWLNTGSGALLIQESKYFCVSLSVSCIAFSSDCNILNFLNAWKHFFMHCILSYSDLNSEFTVLYTCFISAWYSSPIGFLTWFFTDSWCISCYYEYIGAELLFVTLPAFILAVISSDYGVLNFNLLFVCDPLFELSTVPSISGISDCIIYWDWLILEWPLTAWLLKPSSSFDYFCLSGCCDGFKIVIRGESKSFLVKVTSKEEMCFVEVVGRP